MRRALMAVVILAVLVIPGVAGAQETISSGLSGASEGQIVSGSLGLAAEASSAAGVRRLEVSIDGTTVAAERYDDIRRDARITYTWDTARVPGYNSLTANGEHSIQVYAVAFGGAESRRTIKVKVDNAPSAPQGVNVVNDGGTITLTWSANPEPDVLGYVIERGSGSTFTRIADTQGTSYSEQPGPGDYTYRVTAVRPSPSNGTRASGAAYAPTVTVARASSGGEEPGDGKIRHGDGGPGTGTPAGRRDDIGGKPAALPGRRGLPIDAALPDGLTSSAELPDLPGEDAPGWGTYDENLPYDIPEGGVPISATSAGPADMGSRAGVSPDRARWMLAGGIALLVAVAAFAGSRLLREPHPVTAPPPQAVPEPTPVVETAA